MQWQMLSDKCPPWGEERRICAMYTLKDAKGHMSPVGKVE